MAEVPAARQLGRERLETLMEAHAKVQAMLVFSIMGVMATPAAHYSDQALDAALIDAKDVEAAAQHYREVVVRLTEEWRAQRQEVHIGF